MRGAARWSEAAANLDRAHIDQFAGAAAGVLARERAAPAPAVRRGGLDQPAFDAHAVAGAHLAQRACHIGVGGDHVHVGADADDARGRQWRLALPAIAIPEPGPRDVQPRQHPVRTEEPTSELQSLKTISYAAFCLK